MTKQFDGKWERISRILRDAGCEEDFIQYFMRLMENGRHSEAQNLLEKHRQTLLERCHAEERKIDYLDYLSYQMENHLV